MGEMWGAEGLERLSRRERQILGMICDGMTYGMVAEQLVISRNTVKITMHNVYKKTGLIRVKEIDARVRILWAVFCPGLKGLPVNPVPVTLQPEGFLENIKELPQEDELPAEAQVENVQEIVQEEESPAIAQVDDPVDEIIEEDMRALALYMGLQKRGSTEIVPTPIFGGGGIIIDGKKPIRIGLTPLLLIIAGLIGVAVYLTTLFIKPVLVPFVQTQIVQVSLTPAASSTALVVVVTATPPPATPTPIPSRTPAFTSTPAPTNTPVPTPTPSIKLPFADNFSGGISPSWKVEDGQPIISGGNLNPANGSVTLSIGDETLDNYTVEFDYYMPFSGPDYMFVWFGKSMKLGVSPGQFDWLAIQDGKWKNLLPVGSPGRQRDHLKIRVSKHVYNVTVGTNFIPEFVYDSGAANGPVMITVISPSYISNFKLEPNP